MCTLNAMQICNANVFEILGNTSVKQTLADIFAVGGWVFKMWWLEINNKMFLSNIMEVKDEDPGVNLIKH